MDKDERAGHLDTIFFKVSSPSVTGLTLGQGIPKGCDMALGEGVFFPSASDSALREVSFPNFLF
jgi:hypothetical protein